MSARGLRGADEIAADIARRIFKGEWSKNDKLPTTKQLAVEYECSETTIYDAMKVLRFNGLIRGVQGGRRYVR